MSNHSEKLNDIILVTECAKIMCTLAETNRGVESNANRLGQRLLALADRMRKDLEKEVENIKKRCLVGYGVFEDLTRKEFVDRAVGFHCSENMCNADDLSDSFKEKLRVNAGTYWDEGFWEKRK